MRSLRPEELGYVVALVKRFGLVAAAGLTRVAAGLHADRLRVGEITADDYDFGFIPDAEKDVRYWLCMAGVENWKDVPINCEKVNCNGRDKDGYVLWVDYIPVPPVVIRTERGE